MYPEEREIGQIARLLSRSLVDFTRKGGLRWKTRRHLVRQALRRRGGFLVGHAESAPLAVPFRHVRLISLQSPESGVYFTA
jgi:hypothetical protein